MGGGTAFPMMFRMWVSDSVLRAKDAGNPCRSARSLIVSLRTRRHVPGAERLCCQSANEELLVDIAWYGLLHGMRFSPLAWSTRTQLPSRCLARLHRPVSASRTILNPHSALLMRHVFGTPRQAADVTAVRSVCVGGGTTHPPPRNTRLRTVAHPSSMALSDASTTHPAALSSSAQFRLTQRSACGTFSYDHEKAGRGCREARKLSRTASRTAGTKRRNHRVRLLRSPVPRLCVLSFEKPWQGGEPCRCTCVTPRPWVRHTSWTSGKSRRAHPGPSRMHACVAPLHCAA